MTTSPLHITIIGAGIGGLCLAQGLRQRGIAFDVYEKDTATGSRRQGYRLRLDQTGQAALAACLPPEPLTLLTQQCALPSLHVSTIDAQLSDVNDKWVSDWHDGDGGLPDLKINRLTLREILLNGIENHVHFGKALDHYGERADGKVTSHFSDGSSVVSDVLVGADGVHSAVMAQRFPGILPQDTGDICLYGKTAITSATQHAIAPRLQSGTCVLFETDLAVVIDAMQFSSATQSAAAGLTPIPDYLYWAMIARRQRFALPPAGLLSENRLRDCIAHVTASWHPALQSLFDLSDAGSMTLAPIRSATPMPAWPASAVTMLGDAIHVMSPASGMGANAALHDAAALSRTLARAASGDMALLPAIAGYEQQLREHGFTAVAASNAGSTQLIGASPCATRTP